MKLCTCLVNFWLLLEDMTRRYRSNTSGAGKPPVKGKSTMPSVPMPTNDPQLGGTSFVSVPNHRNHIQTSTQPSHGLSRSVNSGEGMTRKYRGNAGPMPTINPQLGGTSSVSLPNHIQTSTQPSHGISRSINSGENMTHRYQVSTSHARMSSVKGNSATREKMPSVPIPTINPQLGSTSSGSHGLSRSIHSQPSFTYRRNNIGDEGASTQNNVVGEGESTSITRGPQRMLLTISDNQLEPSGKCAKVIRETFMHELDPYGINWKSVSNDLKDFYFGEFKKAFYWDSSMDLVVRNLWDVKAKSRYRDFMSSIKTGKKNGKGQPTFVPNDVWESWTTLWDDPDCVRKAQINAANRRGGKEHPSGTHTGGSITFNEHRKRYAAEKGKDPLPSELVIHTHTYNHDGKTFVDERSRAVNEKFEQILQQQSLTQVDIDKTQAFYQAAGGEKKRRIYGLGNEAKGYYGPNLCGSSSDASSSVPPLDTRSIDMDELVG